MSHFTEVKTVYKDQAALVEALEAAFGKGKVEVSDAGLALQGYHGDDRSVLPTTNPNYAPTCNVVVRRKVVGSGSNDIGYRRGEDGIFREYISEFDQGARRTQIAVIPQRYAVSAATRAAKAKGWRVVETPAENGAVKLTLKRKW